MRLRFYFGAVPNPSPWARGRQLAAYTPLRAQGITTGAYFPCSQVLFRCMLFHLPVPISSVLCPIVRPASAVASCCLHPQLANWRGHQPAAQSPCHSIAPCFGCTPPPRIAVSRPLCSAVKTLRRWRYSASAPIPLAPRSSRSTGSAYRLQAAQHLTAGLSFLTASPLASCFYYAVE